MLDKLCLFNTKTSCFFSLLRSDFSLKNRLFEGGAFQNRVRKKAKKKTKQKEKYS